jgi:LicD family
LIEGIRSSLQLLRGSPASGCTAETPKCEFRRWGGDHTRPACCTSHLLELMFFTEDLLTGNGVTHWIDFGTLLGAVRAGELIPWDNDVDFGILEEDVETVLALAREAERRGYHVVHGHTGIRINYSPVNTQHVDLFAWRRRGDYLEPVGTFDVWPGMAGRTRFPRHLVDHFEPVTLYGRPFPAPSPVHELLVEHRFGPDYMTPVRQPWFQLCPPISPEDATPAVKQTVDLISEGDSRLLALLRESNHSGHRLGWLWRAAALPVAPDRKKVERLRVSVAGGQTGEVLDRLLESLALLEQAIGELEHPRLDLPLRRGYRRLVRAREAVVAALARRPHRAGFPFGV